MSFPTCRFTLEKHFNLSTVICLTNRYYCLSLLGTKSQAFNRSQNSSKPFTQTLDKTPVIVIEDISAITRKRLIQKTINFIVPGKQLFLPTLLLLATD